MSGDFHSNMMDEYYAGMVKHMSVARDFEREVKKAYDFLIPVEKGDERKNVNRAPKKMTDANKKSDEFKEMQTALKNLKTTIKSNSTYLNPFKLKGQNLDYVALKQSASDALYETTDYYSMLQRNIDKKKKEGKNVTKEETEYAQKVRDIVDNLEELYGEYNKFLSCSQTFEQMLKRSLRK